MNKQIFGVPLQVVLRTFILIIFSAFAIVRLYLGSEREYSFQTVYSLILLVTSCVGLFFSILQWHLLLTTNAKFEELLISQPLNAKELWIARIAFVVLSGISAYNFYALGLQEAVKYLPTFLLLFLFIGLVLYICLTHKRPNSWVIIGYIVGVSGLISIVSYLGNYTY